MRIDNQRSHGRPWTGRAAVGPAVALVAALGWWWSRGAAPPDRTYDEMSRPPEAVSTAGPRSARVEERLQTLRRQWAQRDRAAEGAADGAPAGTSAAPAVVAAAPRAGAEAADAALPTPLSRAEWATHRSAGSAPQPAQQARDTRRRKPNLSFLHPPWMDEQPTVAEIEDTVLNGTDPARRRIAIEQAGLEEPEDAVRILTGALDTFGPNDAALRVAVLEQLSDFADDLPPQILQPALRDPDPAVRFEAVSLLADSDSAEAMASIGRLTNDPDEDVRALAQGVLELRR